MKSVLVASALASTAFVAASPAMAVGQLAMSQLHSLKTSHREAGKLAGLFAPGKYPVAPAAKCQSGSAGDYTCDKVDLQGHLPHDRMGSSSREGNDIWGWTGPDGREFALVGQTDGTAFVEILKNGKLSYIGRLPTQTSTDIWRDIKVIGDYAYIGSEASNHGVQVFDLRKLVGLKASSPKTFSTKTDLTSLYKGVGSSHNIVANPETNTIFVVGAGRGDTAACKGSNGGLVMVDVSDPSNPKTAGCNGKDGYVHDAQCLIYRGVDKRYQGKEICFGYNEKALTIYDVTSKAKSSIIATVDYDAIDGAPAYSHQGWLLDDDARYLLLDDELDEKKRSDNGGDGRTTTYIFDIADLTNPTYTGQYKSPVASIDHNQYIVDGISYQANYGSGLRVVDTRSIPNDPTGAGMKELAHFDCYPEDDSNPQAEFNGAWSVYPYFKSGTVIVNCIERGLFALKVNI